MGSRKIQDESEVMRWWEQGLTYSQMSARYLEKYNIEIHPDTFAQWRRRKGLPARIVRDKTLIPWQVKVEHRYMHDINMLRLEARRQAGGSLSELETSRLAGWKRSLAADNAVIHYDPDTEQGFFRVLRGDGDLEFIHPPQ